MAEAAGVRAALPPNPLQGPPKDANVQGSEGSQALSEEEDEEYEDDSYKEPRWNHRERIEDKLARA
ncbi:hypothetical protein AMTR_s00006p00182960 [Amborella trichopoda]|uniref:Uncharacterized protein n=1 Tax=Amborella trichopoda TaxID=13333 RepID=W1PF58_AMBTC|nr:hypothetical protein AMTR_s00006p00182960 [Amborella trichopoda]